MAKKDLKTYVCNSCGYQSVRWMGKCPECQGWNTLVESVIQGSTTRIEDTVKRKPIVLSQIPMGQDERIVTSLNEFNNVMGGGIVKDSLTIISGPPGGGKSTLSLMVCQELAEQGYKILYASGEESETQIKNRAVRILGENNLSENIWILSGESLDDVKDSINDIDPDLIVIDSIQTFTLKEYLPARAGNPIQTMECSAELLRIAKNSNKKRAIFIIGQMNKNDQLAGLRALEHLVDTVLIVEGENQDELRTITSTKNRFGSTGEIGFFRMTEHGLKSVDNPSEFFITERTEEEAVSGSSLAVIREGTRPIIVEIESLTSASFTPYPSRTTESMSKDKLNTLLSILEQRGHISLATKNVVVKALGGMKLKESAANLSIIMSIVSAVKDKPIPGDTVFIGDVGLTGEIKRVPNTESRIRELNKMGFKRVFISDKTFSNPISFGDIEVIEVNNLISVIQQVFN